MPQLYRVVRYTTHGTYRSGKQIASHTFDTQEEAQAYANKTNYYDPLAVAHTVLDNEDSRALLP